MKQGWSNDFSWWHLFAGLAKPGPVIETFCSDELVSRYVKLDGVVTLVDSKHALQHLNEVKPRFVVNEAVEQIAYADRIILNKVELLLMLKFNHFSSYIFVWVSWFRQLVPKCKAILCSEFYKLSTTLADRSSERRSVKDIDTENQGIIFLTSLTPYRLLDKASITS